MSLEAKIEELTEALKENTAALLGSEAKTPAKKPAGKKPPAKKPAGKKDDEITVDELAKKFGAYLKTGDKDERAAAAANVKALIDHYDTDRLTNLDAENYAEALDYLKQFEAGEDPFDIAEDDDSGLM